MKRNISIIIMTAALIMIVTTVHAQRRSGPGSPSGRFEYAAFDGDEEAGEAKREEVRRKLETVRMWRLTETLKLDEKTSTQLASFLSSIDEKRRGLIKENREAIKEMRASLNAAKPDEGKLKAGIDRIERNQQAIQELRQKEISGVKGMLTTEQQARYLVFQQDFRREVRRMIAGARGKGTEMEPEPGAPGQMRGGADRRPAR